MFRLSTLILGLSATLSFQVQAQTITVQLPDSMAAAGTKGEWLVKVKQYCEGPIYQGQDSTVLFTEQRANSVAHWPIWRVSVSKTQDTGRIFISDPGQANGMEMDPQGRLVVASNGKILRYKLNGSLDSVLAQAAAPADFNQSNDLNILKNGAIYFTDLSTRVFYISPTRQLSVAATGLESANGIQILEEQGVAYVNESFKGQVTRFDISSYGSLRNPKPFITMPIPDGIEVDLHGNFYVASYAEAAVLVYDAAGKSLGRIDVAPAAAFDTRAGKQGNVSNCTFGGPDYKTLYITGDGGLYSVPLKIPGRPRLGTVSPILTPDRIQLSSKPARQNQLFISGRFQLPLHLNKSQKLRNSLGQKIGMRSRPQ